ncbi:MAG TPA: HEAT repeat domain-containing protein [Chthonomonadaceae bacterium]|nr:HEAT repeat domain-containing protein [Chthonomonadaceae bacterium]
MQLVRKYLNYIIFGVVVLLVVGLAVNHSRHMRALVDSLSSSDPSVRRAAASELIAGEQFSDAITGEPISTRIQAAEALEVLGNDKAVKQLIAMLKDPDKPVRDRVTQALEKIGGNSDANIKELVVGLKDGDAYVRKGTITALTDPQNGIGPKPGVIAAIVDIMKREAGARGPGGDVLGSPKFTQDVSARKESVRLLTDQLKDKDDGVRGGAADALGKVGDPEAVATLKTVMHTDPSPSVRRIAIGAIALIADKSGEDALTEAIKNPNDDSEARAQAAAGLGKIATPTAVATLVQALNDDDLKLRSAAVAALARAGRPTPNGPTNPQVIAALNQALRDQRASVRLGAAQALQAIATPEANSGLIAVLESDQGATEDADMKAAVRSAAATALGFPGNKAAVAPLIKALSDPSGDVATAAQNALVAIGPDATEALIAVLRKGGTEALYAAKALSSQGPSVLPALKKAAGENNPTEQRWAAVALGDLGVADARPVLEQLKSSSDPDVAYVAGQELDKLGRTQ